MDKSRLVSYGVIGHFFLGPGMHKFVCFQGKPFSITVIQAYTPTTNAEETEVERFYDDLKDLLELTPRKMSFSS